MKLRLSTAVAIGAAIVMALFLARGAPAVTGVPCAPTGLEQIATGFPDYMPEETVRVDGSGFQAGCDVTMQVTRPDGSIVVGDGSFTPGSDVVETDFAGNLAYDYTLDGIQGDYQVQALGEGGVVLASTTFSDSINNPPWVYADTNYTAEAFLFERGSTVYFRVPVSGAGNYYKLIVPSPSTFTSGCLAPSGGYITTSWATQSTDQLYQPGYSITVNQYSNSGCTTQTATRTLTNMFRLLNAWSFDNAADRANCDTDASCGGVPPTLAKIFPSGTAYLRVRNFAMATGVANISWIDPDGITACSGQLANLSTDSSSGQNVIDINFPTPSWGCPSAPYKVGIWKMTVKRQEGNTLTLAAFDVEKADTDATTQVHDPGHLDITNDSVEVGTAVHDKIFVTSKVDDTALSGDVEFKLFHGSSCGGDAISTQKVAITDGSPATAESSAVTLPVGAYSYQAEYLGDGNYNSKTAACEPFYIVGAAVTSSSLCSFDVDSAVPGDQFRLIFTPDQLTQTWKLNASNPGQFYYNVFTLGNDPVTITIPPPFVLKGAVPVHVYDGVSVATNGATCYTPGSEETGAIVDIDGGSITVSELGSGFHYIAVHLDYGLKGTNGYTSSSKSLAHPNALNALGNIDNNTAYTFTSDGFSSTIYNENVFKNDPGIGGLVLTAAGDPVAGTQVGIWQGTKQMATVQTDADGWYMWSYKWTGKAATFTVKLPAYNQTTTVTLKANGYLVVNFGV